MRLWLRIAAVLLAGSLLGACGVPPQDDPHKIDLPRQPLTNAHADAADAAATGEVAEVLCLVRDNRLVQTVRRINAPPSVQQQAEHLVAGPTEAERNNGLTSALTGISLRVEVPRGSFEAQVDIAEADEASARSDEMIAYAQIVCTLTSRGDVGSVVFTRANERLEVPRADGSLSQGSLSGSDYADLIMPA